MRYLELKKSALALLVSASISAPAGQGAEQEEKSKVAGPERVVQEQVDAYNRHDLEGFLKTYSPETKLYAFPDQERGVGLEYMRTIYGKLFADNPMLKVKIARRIVQGEYVIDHEQVNTGSREFAAVAIYRVKDDKIIEVRFLK
jgi:hypothetical protein